MDAEGRTFVFDAENKQIEVKSASNETIGKYWYDGDGRRVKKIAYSNNQITETTVFVYDASSRLVAEYSTILNPTPQVAYLTNDHLGSPRINTDENGAVTSRHDYRPYGEEISERTHGQYVGDTIRKQFTGYERDGETGMDFAQARYYSKIVSRFYSVDPENAGAIEDDPQSWNAYAYSRNNPVFFSDPTGEDYRVCNKEGECWTHDDGDFKKGQKQFPGLYVETSRDGYFDSGLIVLDGEIQGTYERVSIDPDFQLVYSVADESAKKGKVVTALGVGAVGLGVCIGAPGLCPAAAKAAVKVGNKLLRGKLTQNKLRKSSKPGRTTKGKTRLFERKGGIDQANKEFDRMKPSNVKEIPDGGRTGTLSNGDTITVRPRSSDGRPTLEIRRPNGRGDEYRYDP